MSEEQDLPLHPGVVIAGKYRVERVLGRGAMGAIALCHHDALAQRVAVKVLLPEALRDDELRARFVREAQAAAKLTSYHVARVSDVGTDATFGPYIVMEYLEGCDLKQLLDSRGALPIPEAVDYVLEAIDAIAEAHSHGIVHRDLKPANLFLADRTAGARMVKVLDFGISKTTQGTAPHSATSTSQILGSPSYMSPEQVKQSKNVDGRSDVWSLGVVLYELLTNTVPFKADSLAELFTTIMLDQPQDVRAHRPDLPEALAAAVMRCVQKEPVQRFADVAMLAHALAPFGTGLRSDCVARAGALLGAASEGAMAPLTVRDPEPQRTLLHGSPVVTPQQGIRAMTPQQAMPAGLLPSQPSGLPLRAGWPEAQGTGSSWGGSSSQTKTWNGSLIVGALLLCSLGGMGAYLWHGAARPALTPPSPSSAPAHAPPAPSSAPVEGDAAAPTASVEAAASSSAPPASTATPVSRPSRPKPTPSASSGNPDDVLERRH